MYRPEWLERTQEEAVEPDLAIIDAHHHMWSGGKVSERLGRFLPADLDAEIHRSGHKVLASVYIEAREGTGYRQDGPEHLRSVGEVETANALAAEHKGAESGPDLCAAIVGYADLTLGAQLSEVLEAHRLAAPNRFRGVRYSGSWDPELPAMRGRTEGMLLRREVAQGARRLAAHGCSLDIHVFHPQIPDVAQLARAAPETRIALNHMGSPLGVGRFAGRRSDVFRAWRSSLTELAACPNVVLKLGGMLADWCGSTIGRGAAPPTSAEVAAETREFYLAAIELFGPDRCMFESDFPVEREYCSYGVLWNSFKIIASKFDDSDRQKLFSGVAGDFYGINANEPQEQAGR